jgi:hypothetical protein
MSRTHRNSPFLTAAAALMLATHPTVASEEELPETATAEPEVVEVEATENEPEAVEVQAAEDATQPAAATPEALPSPGAIGGTISMDRSDWPTVPVAPEDGTVTHHPHFVGNVPMGDDEVGPLDAPDPVWQIQEALAGADAGNLNGENLIDLSTQPFIGIAQFVIMPVQMVLENPWSEATSP